MHRECHIVVADFRRQKIFYILFFVMLAIIFDALMGFNRLVSSLLETIFLILSIILLFLYWKGKPRDVFLKYEDGMVGVYWPSLLKRRSISFDYDAVIRVIETTEFLNKFDIEMRSGNVVRIWPERMLGLSYERKIPAQISCFMRDLFEGRYERR